MQGASVKQTRSVCSERARTPAGGRSRCVFAKQIRGFSAQSPSPKHMRCLSNYSWPRPTSTDPPNPRRIELYAGRGRKENASVTQSGTRFPNGSPGGKPIPESALRLGRSFRMTHQAESASRNLSSEWDSFSGWRLKRKLQPGIRAQNGTRFPNGGPSGNRIPESRLKLGRTFRFTCRLKKPARPPFQNWVEESQNAIAGGRYDCRR